MSADPGSSSEPQHSFLSDGGVMGALMRAHDWAGSPLGEPRDWAPTLRIAVGIMLRSKFPMFIAWGPEFGFLYNDSYSEILGTKHPAALGRPFEEVWAEIWADVSPIAERAMAGEASYFESLPLLMHRKGYDEQTWFTFSYSPLREEDGHVAGVFCACTETTAGVLAQRRQLDETSRLREMFDNSPGFMAAVRGPEHVFELANTSYQQLIGHRDVIGKPVREALPDIAGQGFFELLDQVYRTGEPYTGRAIAIDLQRTPGAPPEERLVDFVFQPMANTDGVVTGIFVEGYDVTERNHAEIALKESEERFRLIADSAPVPMWVTRLDRKRSFVNKAYVDFLGTSREEAADWDWRANIHPDDAQRVIEESAKGEASLQPFVIEARFRRVDGKWRWLRSQSQPRWDANGVLQGFIGVAHDITDAKTAEAALRQMNETLESWVTERTADLSEALTILQNEIAERQRAEEALRQAQKMEAVGQLTGGIAHDFNNLLTPIVGGLELIASRVEDERLKRIADNALEAARRGAKLTGQLLAFSRIQRISMAPIAVNAVIERMHDLLLHAVGHAVQIRTELGADAGSAICDSNQLENAILNLAINARDAMPDGGELTISSGRTRIDTAPDVEPGEFVCVSVADNGHGMSAEVIARATEPFFSTKPVGKGTGLGLAQVYGIAHQSGGTLRIDSEVGRGTTVRILLPAAGASGTDERQEESSQRVEDVHGTGARILVIDDDPDVRAFLAEAIEGLGHEVLQAETGDKGLAMIASETPDLVLVDFAMPGLNGAEVVARAHSDYPDLPIIFVTGYAESEQLDSVLGGSAPVLRKPFGVGELASAIAKNIRR